MLPPKDAITSPVAAVVPTAPFVEKADIVPTSPNVEKADDDGYDYLEDIVRPTEPEVMADIYEEPKANGVGWMDENPEAEMPLTQERLIPEKKHKPMGKKPGPSKSRLTGAKSAHSAKSTKSQHSAAKSRPSRTNQKRGKPSGHKSGHQIGEGVRL